MSKIVKKGFELFNNVLEKTIGKYIVKPVDKHLKKVYYLYKPSAKKVYYLYKPRAKKLNKMVEQNVKKLKSYNENIDINKKNIATTRALLNTIPMSKTTCRIGRKQIDGTCWFQSILNGWLLSDTGRILIKARLDAYKKYKSTKKINTKSCPSPKFDPDLFFSYLDSYVKGEQNLNQTKYKNVNLIANLSLEQNNAAKGLKGGCCYHNSSNIKTFMKNIFGNNWSLETGKDIYLTNAIKSVPGYRLNHCIIAMRHDKGGHAVTGYFCKGKPIVFDSNSNSYLDIDWRSKRGIKQLELYYKMFYSKNSKINIHYNTIFYIKTTPKFINDPYITPRLNVKNLSNKRLEELTGIKNRNLSLSLTGKKTGITPYSNLRILKGIYRRKFKEDPPSITNSKTLYHKIKGIPYNKNIEYEYNLTNNYNDKYLNKFLIQKYGRTNNKLTKNNKKAILKNFYYNTPWYNEVPINIWKKVYKLKFGVNAPMNFNNRKIHKLIN